MVLGTCRPWRGRFEKMVAPVCGAVLVCRIRYKPRSESRIRTRQLLRLDSFQLGYRDRDGWLGPALRDILRRLGLRGHDLPLDTNFFRISDPRHHQWPDLHRQLLVRPGGHKLHYLHTRFAGRPHWDSFGTAGALGRFDHFGCHSERSTPECGVGTVHRKRLGYLELHATRISWAAGSCAPGHRRRLRRPGGGRLWLRPCARAVAAAFILRRNCGARTPRLLSPSPPRQALFRAIVTRN